MMNIISLLLLVLTNGFNLINGIIPYQKNYYISSQISDTHRSWIDDALEILDLQKQDFYDLNCIRIRYDTKRYTGFTEFEGYLMSNNEWLIDKIAIGINPNIEFYNTFLLIMIHELLHSLSCMHNNISGSIMNVSILIINDKVQDVPYPILHQDDINCLKKI